MVQSPKVRHKPTKGSLMHKSGEKVSLFGLTWIQEKIIETASRTLNESKIFVSKLKLIQTDSRFLDDSKVLILS